MGLVPDGLRAELAAGSEPGEWYAAHQLLTAGEQAPAVCLLSHHELRADDARVAVAARSSRAAAHLAQRPRATLVAWGGAVHYLDLALLRHAERDGVHGYLFEVASVRTDDIGVPMRPLSFQLTDWLAGAERWALTAAVLDELGIPAPRTPSP
jgi:hypothetical protein